MTEVRRLSLRRLCNSGTQVCNVVVVTSSTCFLICILFVCCYSTLMYKDWQPVIFLPDDHFSRVYVTIDHVTIRALLLMCTNAGKL